MIARLDYFRLRLGLRSRHGEQQNTINQWTWTKCRPRILAYHASALQESYSASTQHTFLLLLVQSTDWPMFPKIVGLEARC